jgi:type II secretory pathway component GspD/PulD (secretin)
MRTVIRAVLALCITAALAQGACGQEKAQARTEWEYLILTKEDVVKRGKDLAGGLNALGKEGWEMVTVTPWPQNVKMARVGADYYFKRPSQAARAAERKPEPKEVTKVFRLKNAKAASVAKTLERLYGQRKGRMASDDRTNSIVAVASAEHLVELAGLIEELDVPAAGEKGKGGR